MIQLQSRIPKKYRQATLQDRSYRLREEIHAVGVIDGKPNILSLPAGTVVTVIQDAPKEPAMVTVAWSDTTVKVFKIDLIQRGDPVRKSAARSAGTGF